MAQSSGISEGEYLEKSGKLIRIRAKFNGEIIEKIRITGDFFIHPEETIDILEKRLVGVNVKDAPHVIEVTFQDAEYAGISPDTISRGLMEAWKTRS
jgi:hypothetical protein